MNKTWKKLFISILTWLFIFITLGTSTFAWFSLNFQAQMSDINIFVQTNSTYLLIGDNSDIATNKIGLTRKCDALLESGGNEHHLVFPTFYGDGVTYLGTQDPVLTEVGKWYSANNSNVGHATSEVFNVHEIASQDLSKYMLTYKVWITLASESAPYNDILRINYKKVSGDDSVTALIRVATTEGVEEFRLNYDNDNAVTLGNISLSNDTALEVTIIAYINGNSSTVYSDYYNLRGITGDFNIKFEING